MSDPGAGEDVADMEALAAGEDAALDRLMARHAERLFGYLVRLLQNPADAEDLAQETFVRVYEHRRRYDPRRSFGTWLYTIASNLVRDRFRWRSRHPESSLDDDGSRGGEVDPPGALASSAAEGASPEEALLAAEQAEAVRQAVAELPPDLRQPLVLAEYEDRPHAEIGLILGCTAKAVEVRIYRARRQLRRRLERWLQ